MKLQFSLKNWLIGAVLLAGAGGCVDIDTPAPIVIEPTYAKGGFFVNEGIFGRSNGTISHYNFETRQLTNNIVGAENGGFALGDIVQSLYFGSDNRAYAVVNNSNRIVVLGANTFKVEDTIKNVTLPRYIIQPNASFALISEWGANGVNGAVKIWDLTQKRVLKTLATGKGSDKIVLSGDRAYVLNADGFDVDSTVAVINLISQTVEAKINVGKHPSSIEVDVNGVVWVLAGSQWYPSDGFKLTKIAGVANVFSKNLTAPATNLTPVQGRTAFLMAQNNKIYSFPMTGTATTDLAFWAESNSLTNVYGMGVGKDGNLYVCDARGNSPGKVFIFDGSTKALRDSLTVGFYPNSMISR